MNARNTIIGTLIVLAILILANYLAAGTFVRLDLTANKEYTVSPATRNVLESLDDLINVKVYFSRELPTYLVTLQRDVRDLLNEFRAYSGGNLLVEFIDPATDPDVENQVRRLGIPQVQLDVIEQDSRQIQNAYLGIAVLYEDKSEVLPVVSSTENLEYDLTAAIVKVRQNEDKVLGYLTGHQEPDLFSELDQVRQLLERQYVVRPVDLDGGNRAVPEDVNTLLIAGSVEISEREKYLIDQFLMAGGKLLVLEDSIQLVGGQLQARSIRSGLENLLPAYGVRVDENVALDRNCATAGFNSGYIRFMVPYPYWPRIVGEGFNRQHPVVAKLESLVLPWPCTMAPSDQKPEGVEYSELCSTTDQAWTTSGFYNLNPQQQFTPTDEQRYTLAAALSGSFSSYFADKEIPKAPADTTEAALTVAEGEDEADKLTESVVESQILVVGTSHFIRENFLAQFPSNLTFLLNAIDWLTLGEELITIRSRTVSDRPLDPEILADGAEGRRRFVKFIGIFGMPLALGIFGVVRWAARRREKKAFEASLWHEE